VSDRAHLLLPLASSVIYVLGALLIRRAADLGVGVWRATFVSNALSALFFSPLLLLGGTGQPLTALWQPVLLACFLVAGQLLGFIALNHGDVTVATPVMGIKTVVVAVLTGLLLDTPVPLRLWIAAGLSSGAIALLSLAPRAHHRRIAFSVGFGLLAATVFSLFDVLVQKWAPVWGTGRLLPLVMTLGALFSVAFIPLFREGLMRTPRAIWRPLLTGCLCVSVQSILLISSVAMFGDATAINIVYSTRSLWTVLIVWQVGHWFRSTEQGLGWHLLGWRLAGAALMTAAVVITVL
jgi:drug/metabolite transporter (DMT)-like permease